MKSKSKGSIIKVDFEGVEAFKTVPEADYVVGIDEVTKETGSDSGEPYLAWTFVITKGKLKGQKLFYNTSLQPKSLWNLRGVLEAFGLEVLDGVMEIDLKELNDHDGKAGVSVEHEKYEGKNKARVVDVFPEDDVKEGGDGKAGDTEISEDDILAMDEEELAELVKENEIDVDLDDYATLKKKRAAVVAAVEEAQDAGGGKDDKPDEDAVNAMDEDELEETNKEHDLGLDLDDFATIKKKRAAVIEALEEGGGNGGDTITEEAIMEMGKDELKAFVKKHKLDVELEGTTSKQRRAVLKAAKAEDLVEAE